MTAVIDDPTFGVKAASWRMPNRYPVEPAQ
jgi:hypothetical protein